MKRIYAPTKDLKRFCFFTQISKGGNYYRVKGSTDIYSAQELQDNWDKWNKRFPKRKNLF